MLPTVPQHSTHYDYEFGAIFTSGRQHQHPHTSSRKTDDLVVLLLDPSRVHAGDCMVMSSHSDHMSNSHLKEGATLLEFSSSEAPMWGVREEGSFGRGGDGDLLSEDVSESLEKFMTLRPSHKRYRGFDYGPCTGPEDDRKPSADGRSHRKRQLSRSDSQRPSPPRRARASDPTDRPRPLPPPPEIDQEIMDFLHSLDEKKDRATLISEQVRMMDHWTSKLQTSECDKEAIAMTALHRSHTSLVLGSDMDDGDTHPLVLTQQNFLRELIKKQEDEMARIVRQHVARQSSNTHDNGDNGDNDTPVDRSLPQSEHPKNDCDTSKDQDGRFLSKSKDPKKLDSSSSDTMEDDRVELYPGRKVKILNKNHAYASLAAGSAAIFQCAGCARALMAAKSTKLLYCSACGTLTPTDMDCKTHDGRPSHSHQA